jgi:S-adenosylmethionine hydrolase
VRRATGELGPVITLTTDFGEGSPYVAAMKAVLLRHCPDARLIDVSHAVPPFDIDAGAFVLWAGTRHFGPGAVHLAVVDPGVGGDRRRVVVACAGGTFVAPDNGLLEVALEESGAPWDAFELTVPQDAAPTFEGRDVFAPAAGRLAAGEAPGDLAERIDPATLVRGAAAGARVVWIDGFGNLVTNLRPPARPLSVGGIAVRTVARTFSEAPAGVAFCYVGSMGRLEVGVREARADRLLHARAGTLVEELPPS